MPKTEKLINSLANYTLLNNR